jgi:hypothetical protein
MPAMETNAVTIQHGNQIYRGRFGVERGVLTVATARGRRSKPVGNERPEVLARALLREMIAAGEV